MKLYFKFVLVIFLVILHAWLVPMLVSRSTEELFLGLILLAFLPCVIYLIFKEKQIEKNNDSNLGN